MELNQLRQEIDEIDRELVSLFIRRMNCSASVAEYKLEHGLPVLDASRERALLSKISELSGEDFEEYSRTLYATILSLSRSYQHKKLGETTELYTEILKAIDGTPRMFPERAKIACQGVEGAYSQIAAERLFSAPNITFFSNWEGVFSAIEAGMCRYGVIPIENSTAGSVKKVYDLMISKNFKIVRTVRIKIDHCLLAKKGTKLAEIKEIFSHEQAISQCGRFLSSLHGVEVKPCANTAVAAKMVAEGSDNGIAAISSRACAELYGLSILAETIQDTGANRTRFICISKKREIYPGANRTTLTMVLKHKPGALFSALERCNELGVNLVKLESRPLPERDFEFLFYLDLDIPAASPVLGELIALLESEAEELRYLGSYSEVV